MSGVITAVAGAGLVGSLASGWMQSNAAEDAANTQAGASNQANQLQYQMFQQQQAGLQPWVQSGESNLARLNYAMYGQAPSAQSMILDPNSAAYKNYLTANPSLVPTSTYGFLDMLAGRTAPSASTAPTLYQNPLTGEISTTAPNIGANQMGVQGGGLNPDYRYSTQDWQNSPEYAVYAGARDTAIKRGQENLLAQNAASGMYGSGNMANQLQQNVSDQYAMYDPASFSAAQASALGQRQNEYNQLVGLSNPNAAQQVAQYAGQYGQNAAQNIVGAGNALANGQMGQANAWGNALTSGVNQVSNAYGNYQGQQNMNALLAMLQQQQGGGVTQINPNGYSGMSPYSLGGNYSFTS